MDLSQIDRRMEEVRDELNGLATLDDSSFTAEQQARWDSLNLEFEGLRARRDREVRREAVRVAAGNPEWRIPGDGARPFDADPLREPGAMGVRSTLNPWSYRDSPFARVDASELRSRALDAVLYAPGANDAMRARATRMIEGDSVGEVSRWALVASDPAYMRAFSKVLSNPTRGHMLWDGEERAAFARAEECMRAMSLSDSAGGYMVPFQLDPSITLTNTGTINPIREIARKVIATGDVWNGVNSDGVTAEWLGEGSEAADAAPTLTQPSITVHKGAAWVPFSFEVGMDAPNLTQELGRLLSDARDRLEATAFTTGNGTGKPKGIVTTVAETAGSRVASAAADTFAAGDLYVVRDALPARHFLNARWLFHPKVESLIRQFGTSDSHALFARLGEQSPPTLLGRPYHFATDMDGTINASQDNDMVLFGDFDNYVVADRIGSTIELVQNVVGANHRPTGQRGLFLWYRVGADSVNDDAFRLLRV